MSKKRLGRFWQSSPPRPGGETDTLQTLLKSITRLLAPVTAISPRHENSRVADHICCNRSVQVVAPVASTSPRESRVQEAILTWAAQIARSASAQRASTSQALMSGLPSVAPSLSVTRPVQRTVQQNVREALWWPRPIHHALVGGMTSRRGMATDNTGKAETSTSGEPSTSCQPAQSASELTHDAVAAGVPTGAPKYASHRQTNYLLTTPLGLMLV